MKLTDKQSKEIIASYIETGNYSETARKFGVSEATVRNHVKGNPEAAKDFDKKKKENTKSVLQYMESQKNRVCTTLDRLLEAIGDESKIEAASLREIATAFGILVDKYAPRDEISAAADDSGREAFLNAVKGQAVEVWNEASEQHE